MNEPTISAADYVRIAPEVLREATLLPAALHDLYIELDLSRLYLAPGSGRALALYELVKLCDIEKVAARCPMLAADTSQLTEEDLTELRSKREALERAVVAFRVHRKAEVH